MKKFLVITSMIVSASANAANWVHVGEGIDHSTIAVDTESIIRDNNNRNLVSSWHRWIQPNGSYYLVMTKIDCRQKMSIDVAAHSYSPDHYQLQTFGPSAWYYIIPETMDDAKMKFVCKR